MTLKKFMGSEIAGELIAAIDAIPRNCNIVTLKAGENMPITCAFVSDEWYVQDGFIPEYAWNGLTWDEIGAL